MSNVQEIRLVIKAIRELESQRDGELRSDMDLLDINYRLATLASCLVAATEKEIHGGLLCERTINREEK